MAFIPPQTSPGQYGQQVGQMGQQVGQMQVASNLGMGQIWSDLIRNSIGSIIEEKQRQEQKREEEKARKQQSRMGWFNAGKDMGVGTGAIMAAIFGG